MKTLNSIFVIAAVLVTAPQSSVFADMIAGVSLNAQAICDTINRQTYIGDILDLNQADIIGPIGTGVTYDRSNAAGFIKVQGIDGFGFMDTSAYAANTINTVALQGLRTGLESGGDSPLFFSRINYTGEDVWFSKPPVDLAIGSAYLYKLCATGQLEAVPELAAAIRFLRGYWLAEDEPYADWSNSYLQELLAINADKDYWTSLYDPDAYYEEIGNYSVFVMSTNVFWQGQHTYATDMRWLYLANAANPYNASAPVTPEPATMLMFGTGLLALPFVRRLRKK